MSRQRLRVELSTPRGRVFRGVASSVDLKAVNGGIAITPWEKNFLNLTKATELTIRTGGDYRTFVLQNASACLRKGLFTVLAEEIHAQQPVAQNGPAQSHINHG